MTARTSVATPQPLPRRLASPNEAAAYAGVCTVTIRRRIRDGSIVGYRMGPKLIRVDLNEVDTVLLRPIPVAGGTDGRG